MSDLKPAALTPGATTGGTRDQPYQSALLTFTLADDTLLYVDALTADSSLVWTLTGPRGDVASRGFTGSDGYSIGSNPVLAIPAGDYVLRVPNNRDRKSTRLNSSH